MYHPTLIFTQTWIKGNHISCIIASGFADII